MSQRLRTVPSLALIAAMALAAPALARDLIVIDGPVSAEKVKCKGCVGRRDIGNNAVGSGELRNNAVTGQKIKNGAVGTSQIQDGAVTTDEIADGAVTLDKLAFPVGGNDIAPFRVLNNTGGLCDTSAKGISIPRILIDNTGEDEFVVTSILIQTDFFQEPSSEGLLRVSVDTLTINDLSFATRTDNLVASVDGSGVLPSADLMGTPLRLRGLGGNANAGGNFPHQIVAGASSDGADIRIRLRCQSDEGAVSITAIAVSGWKYMDDTVTVAYQAGQF